MPPCVAPTCWALRAGCKTWKTAPYRPWCRVRPTRSTICWNGCIAARRRPSCATWSPSANTPTSATCASNNSKLLSSPPEPAMPNPAIELPRTTLAVDPAWIDLYGHMNTARYVGVFDHHGYELLDARGVGDSNTQATRREAQQ